MTSTVIDVSTDKSVNQKMNRLFVVLFYHVKSNLLLWCYLLLSIALLTSFIGPLSFEKTTVGIVVGTIITTVGAVVIAVLPAYLIAGILAGIIRVPAFIQKIVVASAFVLAGMPSIILGIVGFLVFCIGMQLGWSMISAMLTLVLLLYPTLVTAFSQVLAPLNQQYRLFAKSMGVDRVEFLFVSIPKIHKRELLDVVILGWATSLGDTAAVMLTCGALVDLPSSLMDSVRLINYHIYLLAMEIPGGMPEAQSLSLIMVVFLFLLLYIPRLMLSKKVNLEE